MKTYISEVEGLLMYSPAVFLHKGQKLKGAQDTVEILQALAAGKLVLVDEDKIQKVEVEIPEPEPRSEEKIETAQETDFIPETVKPARRGMRK
ncbi:MAG: hypothetical protein Q7J35_05445 [Candidatus Methanoperedens sp.]|nr:hypothetical protein [Candidatus Methanoperedens sp.]